MKLMSKPLFKRWLKQVPGFNEMGGWRAVLHYMSLPEIRYVRESALCSLALAMMHGNPYFDAEAEEFRAAIRFMDEELKRPPGLWDNAETFEVAGQWLREYTEENHEILSLIRDNAQFNRRASLPVWSSSNTQ